MDECSRVESKIESLIQEGRLKLPGLPDIAVRVRQAIQNDQYDMTEIAKLIQSDIPLTGRLIQVVNSPLYKAETEIEHLQAAITRLGLKVTRNLVFSFTMRRTFANKNTVLNRIAKECWKHSVKIAAIAYVLARITPRLDPEQALLAGLIHNIGVLPILAYAEREPSLLANPEQLHSLIDQSQHRLAVAVLQHWRFDQDYIDIVQGIASAEHHSEGNPNLVDVVICARLLATMGEGRQSFQEISEMPVIQKFPLFQLGVGAAMELLAEAREEMTELTSLLSNA